ncbi:unnamed protein product [Euphydryas editha]|uniref:Uncharacterized protein n=1 Tax=Euphydryas editha TaxID=104508 RepID=A0AAU9U3C3_EUPED|nr:unnamed protein product [Euphydryas editha]
MDKDKYFSCFSSEEFESTSNSYSLSDQERFEEKLLKVFPNNPRHITLAHINAKSFHVHYSDLLTSFSTGIVDFILVSDSIPGYQLFRIDPNGQGGSGVGIYLRSSIPASVVSKFHLTPYKFSRILFSEIVNQISLSR